MRALGALTHGAPRRVVKSASNSRAERRPTTPARVTRRSSPVSTSISSGCSIRRTLQRWAPVRCDAQAPGPADSSVACTTCSHDWGAPPLRTRPGGSRSRSVSEQPLDLAIRQASEEGLEASDEPALPSGDSIELLHVRRHGCTRLQGGVTFPRLIVCRTHGPCNHQSRRGDGWRAGVRGRSGRARRRSTSPPSGCSTRRASATRCASGA